MNEILLVKGISLFVLLIFGWTLSFWILLSNKKAAVNQLLLLFINASLIFIFLDYISSFVADSVAIYLLRLAFAFGVVSVGSFFYFSGQFPRLKKLSLFANSSVLIIVSLFFIISIFTDSIIQTVEKESWGTSISFGSLSLLYFAFLITMVFTSFYLIISKYFKSSGSEKQKIKFVLYGTLVFALLEVIFTIILPIIGIEDLYFIGDYSILVLFALTSYAVVRHGLFDVRLAIVRSVSYALVLITLLGIYASVSLAFSVVFHRSSVGFEQTIIGVTSSVILALVVQPLKKFFDRITNKIFYKDNYNTDDFFEKLNKALAQTTEIRNLLTRVSYVIGETLKAEQAFFFVYTSAEGNYLMAGTDGHNHLPKHDAIIVEQEFNGKNDIVLEPMLKDGDRIKRMMISHRIGLILPLMQEGRVIGYLCLGEHKTSRYSSRDIKVLYTISNELIIAIQNALAVEEIREINRTLQQRIANATRELRSNNRILRQLDKVKDEFISMASHQLRTPLTSVKGYISMVLEGDMGKISESQKQVLEQAFMSSENMVHLINDFLNVSRIQSGKFVLEKSPVDLADLVQQEVNGLIPNAKARDMNLVYNKPKDFPVIEIDEGKIRQVVMNFSDNAIYYSRENTDINIDLLIENNEVVFTVKDHGIGVPKKAREQLFSKFFRAENARVKRPDGTGVGLYLAKKVIDSHGGKIIFESTEGQGSTFGFRLPLEKVAVAEEPTPPALVAN